VRSLWLLAQWLLQCFLHIKPNDILIWGSYFDGLFLLQVYRFDLSCSLFELLTDLFAQINVFFHGAELFLRSLLRWLILWVITFTVEYAFSLPFSFLLLELSFLDEGNALGQLVQRGNIRRNLLLKQLELRFEVQLLHCNIRILIACHCIDNVVYLQSLLAWYGTTLWLQTPHWELGRSMSAFC